LTSAHGSRDWRGDVAIDCARTALRLGAKEVTLVYRRTREEMPASAEMVREAADEGVKFVFLASPVSVSDRDNGQLTLTCVRMELGEPDASGRRGRWKSRAASSLWATTRS